MALIEQRFCYKTIWLAADQPVPRWPSNKAKKFREDAVREGATRDEIALAGAVELLCVLLWACQVKVKRRCRKWRVRRGVI
jgi:hypothetical protein